MVWPAPKIVESPNVLDLSSSLVPHRRLSIGRLHRTASPSPSPVRHSSNRDPDSSVSSSSQRDWQHQRQQQWLDLIPYDPPSPSPPSPPQPSSSSVPSTAIPLGFKPMPGSFFSDPESGLPSTEEEDMFRLVHGASPFTNPYDSPFEPREELQIQPFSVVPSAQPRSSFLSSSSSPPFENMSTLSTILSPHHQPLSSKGPNRPFLSPILSLRSVRAILGSSLHPQVPYQGPETEEAALVAAEMLETQRTLMLRHSTRSWMVLGECKSV
jgi:hypothetical protein